LVELLLTPHTAPPPVFTYAADGALISYAEMTNCALKKIGDEFNARPLAIGLSRASPLKDQLSQAYASRLRRLSSIDLYAGLSS
jgi:hypothetical protein